MIKLTAILVGIIVLGISSRDAEAYSCGTPSADHCYGVNVWQQTEEYFGAYTDIRRGRMICPGGCGGFVDNEIWLVDDSTEECKSNPYKQCWVEAGYVSEDGSQDPQFFWAEFPPGKQFALHLIGNRDPVGVIDHFMIIKDGRATPNPFLIFIYNNDLSSLFGGTSIATGNPMRANKIIIGQELAGNQNAFADDADFTRNIWAVQALGPEYVFWYAAQTAKGTVQSDNPPFATWTIDPATTGAPEGGQFTTHCCM
jgi:hypothetical protein